MRLAIVVTGGLHPSGREQVVPSWLSLFSRLARQHDIHAFAVRHLAKPQTYQLKGLTVHDLGRPSAPLGLELWAQERALARAMAAVGPFDLVHGFWADPAGVLAIRMARRFSIPSIVTCDSGEFVALNDIGYGSQRTARGRQRVREAVRNADVVHVCSSYTANHVAPLGITPVLIPLGVETPAAQPERREGPPWRLLQVASLSRVKNQELLLDALALLKRDDIELDLIGEDTLGGELQSKARAVGLGSRVRFHGFIENEALAPFHRGAHLYVQTSRHESAPIAVLEAAAAGVPVLGTLVGYVADWAPQAARGVEGTADALAVEIAKLLLDSGARRRLADHSFDFARKYDAGYTATEFDRLYRETATPRPSSAD